MYHLQNLHVLINIHNINEYKSMYNYFLQTRRMVPALIIMLTQSAVPYIKTPTYSYFQFILSNLCQDI